MDIAQIEKILADSLGQTDEQGEALPETEIVDIWVPIALNPEKVKSYEAKMIELLKEWPSESWGQSVPQLGNEISYIQAGAVLGDQRRALVLFAFGKLLGWWTVMEPHSMFGFEKDNLLGSKLVGMGYISIEGYKPAQTD